MRELPYKREEGCLSYLLGVENMVLVFLRLFSVKRPTAGAFRVLSTSISTTKRNIFLFLVLVLILLVLCLFYKWDWHEISTTI